MKQQQLLIQEIISDNNKFSPIIKTNMIDHKHGSPKPKTLIKII